MNPSEEFIQAAFANPDQEVEETPASEPEAPADQPTSDQPTEKKTEPGTEPTIQIIRREEEEDDEVSGGGGVGKSFEEELKERFNISPDELKEKVSSKPKKNDSIGSKVDEFISKGIDPQTAASLATGGLKKMSDIDLIKLNEQLEYPNMTKAEVDDWANTKYGLLKDEDEMSETERNVFSGEIKREASKIRAKYDGIEKEVLNAEDQQMKAYEESNKQRLSAWQKEGFSKVLEGYDSIVLDIDDKNKLKIEFTEKEKAEMKNQLADLISKSEIRPDEAGIAEAKYLVDANYKLTNFSRLMRQAALKKASIVQEEHDVEIHNSSVPGAPSSQTNPQAQREEDLTDQIFKIENQ